MISETSLCIESTHGFMKYFCLSADLLRLPFTKKHSGKEFKRKKVALLIFGIFQKTVKLTTVLNVFI